MKTAGNTTPASPTTAKQIITMFDGSLHIAAPSGDGHNLVLLDLETGQVRVIPDEVLTPLCRDRHRSRDGAARLNLKFNAIRDR